MSPRPGPCRGTTGRAGRCRLFHHLPLGAYRGERLQQSAVADADPEWLMCVSATHTISARGRLPSILLEAFGGEGGALGAFGLSERVGLGGWGVGHGPDKDVRFRRVRLW